ncbi:hypothetical protein HYV73_03035 [Candidatus Uhrbacteria bacterium]|nr:hypothetical protein [Candidatus Uhrbacteria bacterium]
MRNLVIEMGQTRPGQWSPQWMLVPHPGWTEVHYFDAHKWSKKDWLMSFLSTALWMSVVWVLFILSPPRRTQRT